MRACACRHARMLRARRGFYAQCMHGWVQVHVCTMSYAKLGRGGGVVVVVISTCVRVYSYTVLSWYSRHGSVQEAGCRYSAGGRRWQRHAKKPTDKASRYYGNQQVTPCTGALSANLELLLYNVDKRTDSWRQQALAAYHVSRRPRQTIRQHATRQGTAAHHQHAFDPLTGAWCLYLNFVMHFGKHMLLHQVHARAHTHMHQNTHTIHTSAVPGRSAQASHPANNTWSVLPRPFPPAPSGAPRDLLCSKPYYRTARQHTCMLLATASSS